MRFVVLGDLHYSVYPDAASSHLRDEFFDRIFDSVARQQAEAVFAIGDTTDNGLSEEFVGLHDRAARHGVKFITVNGNHDVLELNKKELGHFTHNQFPYFALHFNPALGLTDVTDPQAVRFLVMDTPKEHSPKDHGGLVGAEQLAWLANQIAESQDRPLFVFGHHPLSGQTRWSRLPMLSIDNSAQVGRVFGLKRQGQAFYFCGHNHANSISQRANWHFIQTGPALRTSDFRVIDFTPEGIHLQTVALEGGRPTYLLGQQVASALGDFNRLPSRGWPQDRTLHIKFPVAAAKETSKVR